MLMRLEASRPAKSQSDVDVNPQQSVTNESRGARACPADGPREGPRRAPAVVSEGARAKGALARRVDDPSRQPCPVESDRTEGGWSPGLVSLGRDADDGSLF